MIWIFESHDIHSPEDRIDCPRRCAAFILGVSWSLIVLRDQLFKEPLHFVGLAKSAEGISTNHPITRLKKILQGGLMKKLEGESGSQHLEFALTETSNALLPVFADRIARAEAATKTPSFRVEIQTAPRQIEPLSRFQVPGHHEKHNSTEGN